MLTNIAEISEDSLKFWLVKFVAEDVLMKNPIPRIVSIRYAVDLGVLCMLMTALKADDCWYGARAFGHNILAGTVRHLCKEARLDGYFTNHLLKATTATRLFATNVVRSYKHWREAEVHNL